MEEPAVVEKEPPVPEENDASKEREVKKTQRRSKEEKSNRKKDEKSVDQVLKALSSLSTPEEKLAAMCKKYTEIFDESKKHQLSAKVAEKKLVSLQREKEQLQGEQSKAVLTRSRLENLCRELQRQNKAMKEESLLRIREEEEKRKEVSAKFHATLADITSLMQQNTESNSKLRDENLDMQSKFKSVCEQYELREQQVDKISKQMKLESQLAEAKLRKAKLEMLAEKEILERDKQATMAELAMCKSKIIDQEKTEEALRAQINVYFEKYDEFQNVLTKSNQVYAGFKGEMEKMSKKITRLEKETSSWKQKWEGSHKALLQLAAEKQMKDAEVQLQSRQLAQLQKLCRSLQTERTALTQQLKSLGIVPKVEEGSPEKDSDSQETKTEPVVPAEKPKPAIASSSQAADEVASVDIKPTEAEPLSPPATPSSPTFVTPSEEIAGGSDVHDISEQVTSAESFLTASIVGIKSEILPVASVTNDDGKTQIPQEIGGNGSEVVAAITDVVQPSITPENVEEKAIAVSELAVDVPIVAAEKGIESPAVADSSVEVSLESSSSEMKESPQRALSSTTVDGAGDGAATNVISTLEGEVKKEPSPGTSPSSDKKASPAGKGSATTSAGEQKKGKEGGRRRKK